MVGSEVKRGASWDCSLALPALAPCQGLWDVPDWIEMVEMSVQRSCEGIRMCRRFVVEFALHSPRATRRSLLAVALAAFALSSQIGVANAQGADRPLTEGRLVGALRGDRQAS